MQPLVFTPYFRPLVWGDRRLARLGKNLPPEGTYGEAWEVSAHPQHVSQVAEGPLQGHRLTDLWRTHGKELLGREPGPAEKFPLLIKFLDCHQLLSVQVHPDDAGARTLIGDELGKTEAWVVLEAEPGGRIYAGLKEGVTRVDLERHLDAGTVADCLHGFTPRPGDCLFLRAGTVHAVGNGVVIAEVQQSSDATFRLFDWNRVGPDGQPRPLHREQALASIDWSAGPVQPVLPTPRGDGGERLVDCDYFRMDRYRLRGRLPSPYAARMSIWVLLAGEAQLTQPAGGYRRTCTSGETVLVPASGSGVAWEGEATLLGVTVP